MAMARVRIVSSSAKIYAFLQESKTHTYRTKWSDQNNTFIYWLYVHPSFTDKWLILCVFFIQTITLISHATYMIMPPVSKNVRLRVTWSFVCNHAIMQLNYDPWLHWLMHTLISPGKMHAENSTYISIYKSWDLFNPALLPNFNKSFLAWDYSR